MLVAVSGLLEDKRGNRRIAGAGKDEVAKVLVEKGFVSVAFADVMKRFCRELFGFTDEQLWGPSEERAKPDKRYPTDRTVDFNTGEIISYSGIRMMRKNPHDDENRIYLTVRYALQKLGDWGRDCYPDIWANKALEISQNLIGQPCNGYVYCYNPQGGQWLMPVMEAHATGAPKIEGVVLPDCRFQNEFRRVKEEGGCIIRVKRMVDEFPSKLDDSHVSERDILAWGDERFDFIIQNVGTLEDLHQSVDLVMEELSAKAT